MAFVLELLRDHGPLILFFAALVENLGFLAWLPTEGLLAVGGYLIQRGELRADVAWASAFAGVLLGDHVAYLVGRFGGRRLLPRLPFRGLFQQVERLILRYGSWMVLAGRFSGWIRPALLFTIGTMGLPYRRFWPFELLGAAAWSAWWLAVGALGGVVFDHFGDLGPWRQALTVAGMAAGAALAWRYRERLKRILAGEAEPA